MLHEINSQQLVQSINRSIDQSINSSYSEKNTDSLDLKFRALMVSVMTRKTYFYTRKYKDLVI